MLCECEAIINARPLTPLTDQKEGLVAITPEMFLKEIRQDAAPDLDQLEETSYNQRLRYLHRLRQEMRYRFRTEYLGQLVRHSKSKKNFSTIKEDDIVLVASDNQKRIAWPLARVLQVIVRNDEVPRIAKLKTADGELVRSLQRLNPLEQSQTGAELTQREVKFVPIEQAQEKVDGFDQDEDDSHRQTAQMPAKKQLLDEAVVKRTRSGRMIKIPNKLTRDFVSG